MWQLDIDSRQHSAQGGEVLNCHEDNIIDFGSLLYSCCWTLLHQKRIMALQWRPNGHDGVSNHQPNHCLLNRLFRWRSRKSSKLLVTGLCAGNSPVTDEFPAQMASNAENVSIWWRHHGILMSFALKGLMQLGVHPLEGLTSELTTKSGYFYWLELWRAWRLSKMF